MIARLSRRDDSRRRRLRFWHFHCKQIGVTPKEDDDAIIGMAMDVRDPGGVGLERAGADYLPITFFR